MDEGDFAKVFLRRFAPEYKECTLPHVDESDISKDYWAEHLSESNLSFVEGSKYTLVRSGGTSDVQVQRRQKVSPWIILIPTFTLLLSGMALLSS